VTDKSKSFMRSLCMGRIEEDVIFPFPSMDPAQKETLHSVAEALAAMLGPHEKDFRKWDREGAVPAEPTSTSSSEFGAFGFVIPESERRNGFW
jgi:acyl-CoA dehydrogenase family protein 9